MRIPFAYIFWGLLIVFFDFSVNGFDVFPDGLGCLFVAHGASRLANQSSQFITTAGLSALLAAAWLVGLFISGGAAWPFSQIVMLVNLAMHWTLLGGIIEVAVSRNRPDLAARASNRRIAYTVICCAGAVLSYFAQYAGRDALPLVLLIVVPAVVIAIMVLHLVYRASHELA
jgi:hypothetical protein